MVIHYLPSPAEAVAEMARVVKPGGRVVIVDFVAHEHEWMRQELGVHWLGFDTEAVADWFREAGLADLQLETHAGLTAARDLPATFIASGTRNA
jgi:ArsR family transcriptional regulator